MSERLKLVEHFISTQGQAAARVLEELPADVAGGLIDAIADPLSASTLQSMLPFHAAKCVTALPRDAGARYLGALAPRVVAAILRHTEQEARKELLDLLPRRLAVRVSLLLGFPQSLVGAWIDPLILVLPVTATVAEAKTRVANEGYDHSVVYTVDDANKVRGVLSIVDLLFKARDDATVASISRPVADTINASQSLDRAFEAKGWARDDQLPVVDRTGHFLGILRYVELRRALIRPSVVDRAVDGADDLMGLTEVCYLGLADLMSTALAEEHQPGA